MKSGSPDGRNYSVNFRNLRKHQLDATIEFRGAPPSVDESEICAWAEIVMGFVQAALTKGKTIQLSRFSRDVEWLRMFLDAGLNEEATVSRFTYLDMIFEGKSGSLETLPEADE